MSRGGTSERLLLENCVVNSVHPFVNLLSGWHSQDYARSLIVEDNWSRLVRKQSSNRIRFLSVGAACVLPLALIACGGAEDGKDDVAALDESLTGKGSDPAMTTALNEKILVDPDLADSAASNMVRAADKALDGKSPSEGGYATASIEELDNAKLMRAPKPRIVSGENCSDCAAGAETLEERAVAQGAKRGKGTCEAKLQYSAGWANRMPPEFPIYPKGRVKEAAGVEGGICDIRAATFTTSASRQSVVDYYYTRARKSGFTADYEIRDGEHVLGGIRDNDGGAYVITLTALANGGTQVDIVANNGR